MNDVKPQSSSPLPLYVQIKESLRQRIVGGEFVAHQRLPSEAALMQSFGVSRITVRQALRDLHKDGLVFSSQGKGTFVSMPKAVQDVHRLEGFGEAMERQGYATFARVICTQERQPPEEVRNALQLAENEEVVEVKRVRYLNNKPVSVDMSYFPLTIGRRLFGRDLSGDIFPLLENQLGIALGAADIVLEAAPASREIAQLLDMRAGDSIMRVQRLTHDPKGNPIDFEYLSYRGDAYQYRFRIDRQGVPA